MNKKYRNTNEKERLEKVYSKEAVEEAVEDAENIGWMEFVYRMCDEFGCEFEDSDYEYLWDDDNFNPFSLIDFGNIEISVIEWMLMNPDKVYL